ncbi:transcriptional regulator, TetR family [Leptospira ryugenii]|uniref:Transcriptional regulator, TetR family n=1 Tax=Leptospira ryugenii TaxID=1917863 RepID=A0A2P2E0G5_9LEPT|nr:TetR/AcrR family transcriptional regulator [Leptospira ryugenii]GBF50363.1 transcriptional regulator, TetR family [Leptospira ryugenii]
MSTKDEILKLANRELQEKGLHSLSFRELAASLGIKSSSIHYHFPQKDDLIQTLITEYRKSVFGGLKQMEGTVQPGRERLVLLVEMIGKSLESRQCTAGVLAAESAQISENAKDLVRAFFEELMAWIKAELSAMGKTDEDAQLLSSVILSAIEGSLMLDCFNKRSEKLNHVKQYIKTL